MSIRQYGIRLTLSPTSEQPSYTDSLFSSGILSLSSHEAAVNGDELFLPDYLIGISSITDRVDIAQGGNYAQIGSCSIELTNTGGTLAIWDNAGVSLYGATVQVVSIDDTPAVTVGWIGIVQEVSWIGDKIRLEVESVIAKKHKKIPSQIITNEEYPLADASFVGKPLPLCYGTLFESPAYPINGEKSCIATTPILNHGDGYWSLSCSTVNVDSDPDDWAPNKTRYNYGFFTLSGKTLVTKPVGTRPGSTPDDYIYKAYQVNADPIYVGASWRASAGTFCYDEMDTLFANADFFVEIIKTSDPSAVSAVARIESITKNEGTSTTYTTWTLALDQTPQVGEADVICRIFNVTTQYVGDEVSTHTVYPVPEDPNAVVTANGFPVNGFTASGPGFSIPQPLLSAPDKIRGRIWIPAEMAVDTFATNFGDEALDRDADTYSEEDYFGEFNYFSIKKPDLSAYDLSTITTLRVAAFITTDSNEVLYNPSTSGATPEVTYFHNWEDDVLPLKGIRLGWLPFTDSTVPDLSYMGALPYGAGIVGDPSTLVGVDVFDETRFQANSFDVFALFCGEVNQTESLEFRIPVAQIPSVTLHPVRAYEIGYVMDYEIDRTKALHWTGWQTTVGSPADTNAGLSICGSAAEILAQEKIWIDPSASDATIRANVVDTASVTQADTDLVQMNGEYYETESFRSYFCRIQLDALEDSASVLARIANDWNLIIAPDTSGSEVFTCFLRYCGGTTFAYSVTDADMVEGSIVGVDITSVDDLINEPIVSYDYSSLQELTRSIRVRSIETDPATLTATNYTSYVTGVGDFSVSLSVFQILHQSWQRYGLKVQGERNLKTVPYLQDRYSPQGALYSDFLPLAWEPIRTVLTSTVGTSWLEWASSRKKILTFTILENQAAANALLGNRIKVNHYRYTAGQDKYGTLCQRTWNPSDGTVSLSVMLDITPYTAQTIVYRDTLNTTLDIIQDTLNASLDTLQDQLGA